MLGSVVAEDASVKRKLLTHIDAETSSRPSPAFTGWYFDSPAQLHALHRRAAIGGAVDPCPAWFAPAGRGRRDERHLGDPDPRARHARAECLCAVPAFREPASRRSSCRTATTARRRAAGRQFGLGATECAMWTPPSASPAPRREAIVLMGWSMGGPIALQLALSSAHAVSSPGVVLDSPVVDWRVVLDHQARLLSLPHAVTDGDRRARCRMGDARDAHGEPIPFDRLDVVARADALRHPILILHSDDDGFVPVRRVARPSRARPDLVTMQRSTPRDTPSSGTSTRSAGPASSARGSASAASPGRSRPETAEPQTAALACTWRLARRACRSCPRRRRGRPPARGRSSREVGGMASASSTREP